MSGNLISLTELRAAQNKSLERLGLAPVSETEYETKQHMGVIFDDYARADTAADEINDWACVQALGAEPVYPNRTAHLTGFSSKCSIEGRRLYIPLTTPDTATQES